MALAVVILAQSLLQNKEQIDLVAVGLIKEIMLLIWKSDSNKLVKVWEEWALVKMIMITTLVMALRIRETLDTKAAQFLMHLALKSLK